MSVMNLRPEREVIEEIANIMGIDQSFVEKDWYVVQIVGIIAGIQHDDFEVVFSGGTALSKAHKLLQRFSEDIDFRVLAGKASATRKSLSTFKGKVADALRQGGFAVEDGQITAGDGNRFVAINLNYESHFPRAESLRPHILIELTAKDIQLPHLYLPVSSFVNDKAKRSPEVSRVGCIDPVESAADKLSAIAWRIPDRVRGSQDDPSLVRHIHDLAILKDTALQHREFPRLVAVSMEQDNSRPKNDASISELSVSEKFQRMLDVLQSDKEYAQEYERFVRGVSYAAPEKTPGFKEALDALQSLVKALGPDTKI